MLNRRSSLAAKLENDEYLDSLSERERKQLLVCRELLTDNELSDLSSIRVGYKIARNRYIEEHYGRDMIDVFEGIPLFFKDNVIK